MALFGYIRKGKPAPWKEAFPAQVRTAAKEPKPKKVRKPIKQQSTVRSWETRKYRSRSLKFLKQLVEANQRCPVTGAALMLGDVQMHHKFGRRGKLLLWEPGWIAVSSVG